MDRPDKLGRLTDEQWEHLQEVLERFEDAWQSPGPAADLTNFLPPPGDPLRPVLLHELVKTDLEYRARRGEFVTLDRYLRAFPELGPADGLPAALVFEEYRARRRFGDKPTPDEFRKRFPAQAAEVERLARRDRLDEAPKPPPETGPAPPADPKTVLAEGNYRLIERLARGASGEVWRAEAPGGVEVAVKVVFGSIARGEARRELEALAVIKGLRHPFLLPIHASWQQEDRLVIAMELADGCLAGRHEKARRTQEPIPGDELLGYIKEAAEALDYLHAQRVLHRDVKPSNILLLQGHAKVADFGLAILVEQTRRLITASDSGTPAYTAPEVFWRRRVSAQSDQYSLAATYAELRLGHPLFPSQGWLTLMQDHLRRPPDLRPLLEAEQQVLRRALAKEPEHRFGSCQEFVKALARVVPR